MRFPVTVTLRGSMFHEPPTQGEAAVVVHEPTNPHDANAMAAQVHGRLVGYLPAPLAARVVGEHGEGVRLVGEVESVRPDGRVVQLLLTAVEPAGSTPDSRPVPPPTHELPEPTALEADDPCAGAAEASSFGDGAVGLEALTRSGRRLGVVAAVEAGDVVCDLDGSVSRYPAQLVLVRP